MTNPEILARLRRLRSAADAAIEEITAGRIRENTEGEERCLETNGWILGDFLVFARNAIPRARKAIPSDFDHGTQP